MENVGSIKILLEVLGQFGFAGLILYLWWSNERTRKREWEQHVDSINAALKQAEQHMQENRRMYENNVYLVEDYKNLAGDLKDVVMVNTRTFTSLTEAIQHNQFCPMVRLEKRAEGVQL